jgi:hypothetical protein
MASPDLPPDVIAFLIKVFRDCNSRVSETLSNNPNGAEQFLDFTWIQHVSQYATTIALPSRWAVRIETHYLGGLRHLDPWEIADIGVLLFVKRGGLITLRKVALLQSKRLYPTTGTVTEESLMDYRTGFARLADPEDLERSIGTEAEFQFDADCRYGALRAGSPQVGAIERFHREHRIPVYYQFYNPWRLPFTQRVPLTRYGKPDGDLSLGVRVVPSSAIHALLEGQSEHYRLGFRDLSRIPSTIEQFGWPLETFMVDLFIGCREGSAFQSINQPSIQTLFYRRSGPIAAALAITIEEPT